MLKGEGMVCGGLPFPDTDFHVPDDYIYCVVWTDYCLGYCFYIRFPEMFLSMSSVWE